MPDAERSITVGQVERLRELAGEMASGAVQTLVILGADPVYTAPADLEFEANIKKVPVSIYLGPENDETAAVASGSLPQAHYLEAWGDVTAPDGTATIQQPMIEPLFGGKTSSRSSPWSAATKTRRRTTSSRTTGWRSSADPASEPAVLARAHAESGRQPVGP